ncbi:MAG: hypothetical protein HQL79_12660, partial [Magnetococcales bacterium]|nr:hypothetical protein [Magnetococcales bacterium]
DLVESSCLPGLCCDIARYFLHDSKAADTPILMMTDRENEEMQSRGIHEGAQDFLIKHNLSRRMLARAFRFALERHWFFQRR